MKVKYRLPMVIILVAIIPVLVVAVVGSTMLSNASLSYFKSLIANQSAASAKHLQDFFTEQSSTIRYSAKTDTYVTYLQLANNDEDIPSELEKQALKLLYLSQQVNPGMYKAYIVDTAGEILLSSEVADIGLNVSDDLAFEGALQNKDLAYRTAQHGNQASIVMAMPIADEHNGVVLGVLLHDINMDYLNRYVRELIIGQTGYLYVLDSSGNILSHYYKERMDITELKNDEGAANLLAFTNSLKNNTLQNNNGTFEYSIYGRPLLASYEIVPEIGWAVVAVVPLAEITESAQEFKTAMLVTVIFVIIIAVLLGLINARKITLPLEKIRETVASIASGNLDAHMKYDGNDEFSALYSDIELMAYQLKKSYAKLSKSAKTDVLTGIPNRMAVYEEMDNRFNNTINQAALLLDLDGFKEINDTLGHDYGDAVLIRVASIINDVSDENIIGARLGGDEFFVYVSHYSVQNDIILLGEKILREINSVHEVMGKPVSISASVGIAFVATTDTNKSYLIKKADLAMYNVKKSGKSGLLVYDNSIFLSDDL